MENKKRYRCTFCGGRFEDEIKKTHICPFCETEFSAEPAQKATAAKPETKAVSKDDELVKFEASDAKKPTGLSYELYTLLHDLVYILAAITFIFVFAFRLVGVDGDSMFGTLHNKDYLIVKNNLFCRDYSYGDIVIAATPAFENSKPIVKRVIATEGQTIDVRFDEDGDGKVIGKVYVDGVLLEEDYIREPMDRMEGSFPVTVPEGCVFLMGDNRNNSRDSRSIGCVNTKYLLGKVLVIALPGDNSDGRHLGGAREWSRIGTVD
ncbi:MAG: signal peptidase I [Clostridia bacterium]|nr:signal peptidase I [Clostridia bacterium]